MLEPARCKILTPKELPECAGFILSERGLFIFDNRGLLETCGEIPLLRSLDPILETARAMALSPPAVFYW
jgi:hypothetical protein